MSPLCMRHSVLYSERADIRRNLDRAKPKLARFALIWETDSDLRTILGLDIFKHHPHLVDRDVGVGGNRLSHSFGDLVPGFIFASDDLTLTNGINPLPDRRSPV